MELSLTTPVVKRKFASLVMWAHLLRPLLLTFFLSLWLLPLAAQPAPQFVEDEAEENVNISFALQSAAAGSFSVVFDYKDAANFYALDCAPGSIAFRSILGGHSHRLANASHNWKPSSQITIQRRSWLMQVIVDGTVALTAYDVTLTEGRIGQIAAGDWKWSAPRVQPVEAELYFNDDFTREEGKTGEWKNASGTWKLTTSSDNINTGNQAMSANPFSYEAIAGTTPSFTHTGRAFWDSYHAQVSARPQEQGTVGLAVYVQDHNNYLAFLWSSEEGPDARQLVKVSNGQSQVLSTAPGAFLPRQWYRLGVRTSPGIVETFIDGTPVFRINSDAFGQGGIGLYARQTAVNFDDVRVRSYPYFRQDFNGPTGGAWTPQGGFWRAADGILNAAPKPGEGSATRMLLAGSDEWSNYEMTASGKPGDVGSCGLVVGYRDDKNYTVLRWAGNKSSLPFKGRAQLLRYANGSARILSDVQAPVADAAGFSRIKLRFRSGAITAFAQTDKGSEMLAQTADETLQSGRVGLWVQGTAAVSFREVVMFLPPEPDAPKVAPKMESDALMVGWASPAGEWPNRKTGKDGKQLEFWNTGEFFGDLQAEYLWRPAYIGPNAVEWALRANNDSFTSGYVLRAEGKDTLKLTLSRGSEPLRTAQVDLKTLEASDETPPKVQIELEGKAILVSISGVPALSFLPEAGTVIPDGTRLAVRGLAATGQFILAAKDLRAVSANRDDYTFNEAPTDWYAPSGNWNIFSRWPCYADWSFFGGKGLNPVLWSKREYSGDIVVEMYVHPQMNLPKDMGYSHPGDLNVTLAGDGRTAASGYSFVLAGWSNTRSAILKKSQVVAENRSDKAIFYNATNQNSGFHRRWYYVRAEARRAVQDGKNGVRLKFFVDENLMGEYFDATPLETFERGRVAFWTVDGAMMIARAKIENEAPGAASLPSALPDAMRSVIPSDMSGERLYARPLKHDGQPTALVETTANAGNGTFKVTNPTGGGQFGVTLHRPAGDDAWRIDANARYDMEMLLTNETKVDLYFTIDGVRHVVEVSGEQRPEASAKSLGHASQTPGVLENGRSWRHISFALGQALKAQYPQSQTWAVQKIEIGALHGDEYRWQGFAGNPLGASYQVRNARLR
jgi:hypothetical protein